MHNEFNILFDIGYRKDQDIYTNNILYNFPLNYLQQSVFEKSNTNGVAGTINIGYKVNEKLQLGLQYSGFSTDANKENSNINNIINYQNQNVNNTLLSDGITNEKYNSNSLNFNAIKSISNSDNKIMFDVDYFNLNTNRFNNLNSHDFKSEFTTVDNNNLRKIENVSSKIDFDILNKWANLSFGAKISFTETNNDIDISRYNIINKKPKSVYNQLDYFTYNENIQAIYFSANRKFGTKLEGKIGLRTEFTQSKGYSETENKTNTNKYVEYFPSVYLSYLHDGENTFTLSYGRRVNRPSYSNLNPARWYLTLTSYEEGNPFLQPSFTSNFELSHSYRNFLTTTVSFSKTKNGFGQLTIHDAKYNMQAFVRRNYYNYNLFLLSEYIN
ncbi:outer membrane beta-barrel family protein [Riemerella anatipestifer]|uniref:outer membrane beta-barrel family protein n=1 Tax=Riemerella anatipestifer TaxID=34085 RepID=UPI0012AD2812|nr:outer membrane beta-barrel family protein [Riemerella anatipestifer]MCQ4156209.1 outer membrane beta-barrel family protein [Riemerella anatipestifer]MDR7776301.1 outer membrane beta-barrel family protein [Riemerella anatipestifer]MDY3347971.1 outer membrane beta-barrel family protein [Riemerella anatipestifer]MDY3350300.1 outer membrane beta-barrel family protein [Riemerella anatipestifer]MDY3398321.1 outer membrane beta-barrel family protein [Riemerella anatipestifer]